MELLHVIITCKFYVLKIMNDIFYPELCHWNLKLKKTQ